MSAKRSAPGFSFTGGKRDLINASETGINTGCRKRITDTETGLCIAPWQDSQKRPRCSEKAGDRYTGRYVPRKVIANLV
jgi:hypothetical protein